MTVLAQGKLVRVKALEQNMNDLDQITLQIVSVAIDEVPESLQYILLMLNAFD